MLAKNLFRSCWRVGKTGPLRHVAQLRPPREHSGVLAYETLQEGPTVQRRARVVVGAQARPQLLSARVHGRWGQLGRHVKVQAQRPLVRVAQQGDPASVRQRVDRLDLLKRRPLVPYFHDGLLLPLGQRDASQLVFPQVPAQNLERHRCTHQILVHEYNVCNLTVPAFELDRCFGLSALQGLTVGVIFEFFPQLFQAVASTRRLNDECCYDGSHNQYLSEHTSTYS